MVSLGAVLPFLGLLSNPDLLWQQPFIQSLSQWLGYSKSQQLVLPATLAFAIASILAAVIRLLNLWLNVRLGAAIGSDLSCAAYERTLYQPYEVHVQRNSAEVITGTTTHIGQTVAALNGLLQLITSAVVAASLLLGLLLIDAPIAVASAAIFASSYGALAISSRRELSRNSSKIAEFSTLQVKALNEGLGSIRDVLLDGSQNFYSHIYRQADIPLRYLGAKNYFLTTFPRYALEALGMVAIALLGGLLVFQRDGSSSVIPLLGALALGAQRLLPALQQVYSGWASLHGFNAGIHAVLSMLNQPLPPQVSVSKPLQFREVIRLEQVSYKYGVDQPYVLQNLELEICRGERVGLIGSTGSGKSTLVDILMGLLQPKKGRLLVDGADLHDTSHPDRLAAWRAAIAHVPQSIYLADTSIAENIAFGVPLHLIDMLRVREAAAQAQIACFIESSSEGYSSFVGERGIRLSGGQRQRLGIARALYRQASVIVLDEATSALDTTTEKAVMEAVEGLSRDLTMVMIAHRISTVQNCDRLIRLENGILVPSDFSGSSL